jgi:hypothetical protein
MIKPLCCVCFGPNEDNGRHACNDCIRQSAGHHPDQPEPVSHGDWGLSIE